MKRNFSPLLVAALVGVLVVSAVTPSAALASASMAPDAAPLAQSGFYYVVDPGDTLSTIAQKYGLTASKLASVNNLSDPDHIVIGQRLWIPTGGSSSAPPQSAPQSSGSTNAQETEHGSVAQRMTATARASGPSSPFYKTTWVTYYGRPGVPILGILGEYGLDGLVPRLQNQADAYDYANGPGIGVKPAFHLIYGLATKWDQANGSHLAYMDDDETLAYVKRGLDEGFGVILDVQIGARTPVDALQPALEWLQYPNVHLALDPEFAMTTEGQEIPGMPPGMITAKQINQAQWAMSNYMQANGIQGRRILIIHQFLPSMIQGKEYIYRYDGVDLTICADGFGAPWPKISKYNLFMDETVQFAAFKLFYGWVEPLMSERQAMGVDPYPRIGYMEVAPNLIIYQ